MGTEREDDYHHCQISADRGEREGGTVWPGPGVTATSKYTIIIIYSVNANPRVSLV